MATLAVGGCAQQSRQVAVASHGKEYFPSSVYGAASRRVIADGQPVPRGGGQYLVGRPYTVAGQTYYPSERKISQVGNASWYGDAFHGRLTANGEIYDRDGFTAAHPTMPLPSYARVTNLRNNSSMIVRVNDRGPYASNRVMDVSRRVAEALDFKRYGTAKIKVEYVGRASLAGSDDGRLFATLRTDGPAQWQGEPTRIAAAAAGPARVATIASSTPDVPHEVGPVVEERPLSRGAPEEIERRAPRARISEIAAREPRPVDRHEHFALRGPHSPSDERPRAGRETKEPVARTAKAGMMKYSFAKNDLESASRPSRTMVLPPSRPMDLGTIPGADSRIGAHHRVSQGGPQHGVPLRLARSRDD